MAYEEQGVDNSAPRGALIFAIASLIRQLVTQYSEHNLLTKARTADSEEHRS